MGGNVAKVNQTFEISAGEAGRMWVDGGPLPPETEYTDTDFERLRRSENGAWLVRLNDPAVEGRLSGSAAELAERAGAEFARLRAAGVNVVTHAITPSVLGRRIFTVSPWIDGVEKCSREAFDAVVQPALVVYFNAAAQAGHQPRCMELDHRGQFSIAPAVFPEPFMHDVDIGSVL